MKRTLVALGVVMLAAGAAHAQSADVFEVCKGESKGVVSGKGKMSIAIVYPDDFPAKTTPAQRNTAGAVLAKREKAKIVPNVDTVAARKLVEERKWGDQADACDLAPGLVAVLGLKHPNLSTATASVECDAAGACMLHYDLERHGQPSKDRWVRYSAPIKGDKTQTKVIMAAAKQIKPNGEPPNHPMAGLASTELATGKVTVRSDVDGSLEVDRVMESSPAFAACGPPGRKAHDVRGYYAEWQLSARGGTFQVSVKPFAGRDPADAKAAECLKKAIESTKVACPRDGKPIAVKTAICL
jgi:hypothetical protein